MSGGAPNGTPVVRLRPPALLAVLGGGALVVGAIGWLVVGAVDGVTGVLAVGTPAAEPSGLLRLLPLVFAGVGAALLVGFLTSFVRVAQDGTLSVRSWAPRFPPPWRVRRIALGRLASVSARAAGTPHRMVQASRVSTALTLTDVTGHAVEVNPEWWADPQPLLAVLRQAVARTGASVSPLARRALDDPTTGSRL